jgi:dynein heavy chain
VKFGQAVPKMPKPERLTKEVVEDMLKFREYLPVIRSICNPGLKERRFKDIRVLIEKQIDKNEKLRTLMQLKIEKYKDKLEEISDTASKEYSNERTLNKMNDDWQPMEFLCKEYRGSFILEGEAIELITALLDDHIIKA